MKKKVLQIKSARFPITAMALLLLMGGLGAYADEKDNEALQDCVTKIDAATKPSDETPISAEIAEKFTPLAGSETNANALVAGLHKGSSIKLTSTVDNKTTTTFTPATGKQGFGNVYITLTLAQEKLAEMGIIHPTPAQLEAVLNGGTLTTTTGTVTLSGILALRASGQGWGEIAQTLDVKLGRVLHETRDACERIERRNRREMSSLDRSTKVEREEPPVGCVERVSASDRPSRVENSLLPKQAHR